MWESSTELRHVGEGWVRNPAERAEYLQIGTVDRHLRSFVFRVALFAIQSRRVNLFSDDEFACIRFPLQMYLVLVSRATSYIVCEYRASRLRIKQNAVPMTQEGGSNALELRSNMLCDTCYTYILVYTVHLWNKDGYKREKNIIFIAAF